MKNKDFKVSRSCFICPYRAQAHDREQFADDEEQGIAYCNGKKYGNIAQI